jgi:hypothetical protein
MEAVLEDRQRNSVLGAWVATAATLVGAGMILARTMRFLRCDRDGVTACREDRRCED